MDIRYFEGETAIGPFRKDIFATPIFVGHAKTDIAQRAEKLALEFRDQTNSREGLVGEQWSKGASSEDKKDFDKYGVTSFYSRNLVREEEWQDVKTELEEICKHMLGTSVDKSTTRSFNGKDWYGFVDSMKISNMWTTLYPEESFIPMHIHSNYRWSAVFYAKAEKNCGDIVWQDPSWITKTMTQGSNPALNPYYTTYQIAPETGTVLLFPAWLPHRTIPNKSGEDRIIISFNLFFEDEEICFKRNNDSPEESNFKQNKGWVLKADKPTKEENHDS